MEINMWWIINMKKKLLQNNNSTLALGQSSLTEGRVVSMSTFDQLTFDWLIFFMTTASPKFQNPYTKKDFVCLIMIKLHLPRDWLKIN